MFWIRSGLHSISISDWLTAGPTVTPVAPEPLDDAREAMLDVLGDAGEKKHATLALRIRKAADMHSLWAIRPDLMTAACKLFGESAAHRKLSHVTTYFEGILPAATARKRKTAGVGASR